MWRGVLDAVKSVVAWTDARPVAASVAVVVPAFMILVAWTEYTDWLVATLTVLAGLCWIGVMLPEPVRNPLVLVAGGLAAICGALVSIIFSNALQPHAKPDPSLAPLVFALLAAGSASIYGQHRIDAERRVAERAVADLVADIHERVRIDSAEVRRALGGVVVGLEEVHERLTVSARRRAWWSRS